jgi:transglutaminase-like putative cysteine protease
MQKCRETRLMFDSQSTHQEITGEDGIGTRRWVQAGPMFECRYETKVEVTRPAVDLMVLTESPRMQIPSDVIQYLMPSRYCQSEQFLDFVSNEFGTLTGGPLVAAMRDWIAGNFTYDASKSFSGTTAADSFASQAGVCRDFAHVLIAFARAAGIPSRFVSVYAPDVVPQDFHAVAEVYLMGAWHIVDATGMAKAEEIVRICVGRDAADASFMTSYGWVEMQEQSVEVRRVSG